MKFLYKAKKGPTEIVEGEIDAENEDAALGKISGLGLIPVKLFSPEGAAAAAESAAQSSKAPKAAAQAVPMDTSPLTSAAKASVRVSHKNVDVFTRQFAILMKASVPLLRIFQILQAQTTHKKFNQVLQNIQDSLRQGGSLSETLGEYPRIFPPIYVNMVNSGEASGTLEKVLIKLAEFSEREAEIRSKVKSAFIYPAFLLLVGIGTVFILLTFVMPRLMGLFADLGTVLPLPTRIIIAISKFLQAYWIFILPAVGALVVLLKTKGLSEAQKKNLDVLALKLPVLGDVIIKSEVARFLRSLSLLYESGIPLYRAASIAARTVSNTSMRTELEKVMGRLEGGATLAKSLQEVPYISNFVSQMVSVGEESGQLSAAVGETASFYEQETNQFIRVVTSLIEPLMILIIGVVIGFIVVAMLLPIFEIHVLAQ